MLRLRGCFPRPGRVEWIGLRPRREQEMEVLASVLAVPGRGLEGDRYRGSRGVREVSLIQSEHLPVIARLAGLDEVLPSVLRRNILVSGVNLSALIGRSFRIGDALLHGTGACHPCSRMEAALGPGGCNAMRGHGGITARVVEQGGIAVGDALIATPSRESL